MTNANTSAPVVICTNYNFVAGDVGNWWFLKSGTSGIPGWYKIASVASNAATLTAGIGTALSTAYVANTVAGCGTAASLTSQTGSIDYSQTASPTTANTLTGLTSAGAGLVVLCTTSTKAMIGNGIQITGGTNFNVGIYNVSNVSVGVNMTLVGPTNADSGVGASGTANVGGALASPGMAGLAMANIGAGNLFIKTGTYNITSNTQNIAGGCFKAGNASTGVNSFIFIHGYNAIRGDLQLINFPSAGQRPIIKASSLTSPTLIQLGNANCIECVQIDGQAGTSTGVIGLNCIGSNEIVSRCLFTGRASATISGGTVVFCEMSSAGPLSGGNLFGCVAHGSSGNGFTSVFSAVNCISYNNTSSGFTIGNLVIANLINCISYGNTNGFFNGGSGQGIFINCLAVSNSLFGFTSFTPNTITQFLSHCAAYANTSGNVDTTSASPAINDSFTTLTADPFTNAAGGDFSLNNTAGGGASCRAAGIPGVFPGGLTTGYPDIGAVQSQAAGSVFVIDD